MDDNATQKQVTVESDTENHLNVPVIQKDHPIVEVNDNEKKELIEKIKDSSEDSEVRFLSSSGVEWKLQDVVVEQKSGVPDVLKIRMK